MLGNRTPLQVKNRARHLILYETGTKLSDVLREMANNNDSNCIGPRRSPHVVAMTSRRSITRTVNYAESSNDEEYQEEVDEESESPLEIEEVESGICNSDTEKLQPHLHLSQSGNTVQSYYGDSDSISSINPSLLLPQSVPSRPPLLPIPLKSMPSHVDDSEDTDEDYNEENGDEIDGELVNLIKCAQISEKEMAALPEFFQGMSLTRTPERYLKIRSTILSLWNAKKPQYVTKLSARVALRGIAGDVSLISKVHAYLEKAKLINICLDLEDHDRRKKKKPNSSKKWRNRTNENDENDNSRRKSRTKFQINGLAPLPDASNGGTMIARSSSASSLANSSSQGEFRRRPRTRALGLDPFELQKLTTSSPFKIEFTPLVFTLLHVHAFLSLSQEIIGVLGGHINPTEPNKIIVTQVYPCKSQVMSMTECEMDPFSELQACELFSKRGCSMIGWYHSHPTFPSNPSRRDLETQALYQKLYEWSSPDISANDSNDCVLTGANRGCCNGGFVGAIISPRKDCIELTCFQSTLYANSLVMGQSVNWKINTSFPTTHNNADPYSRPPPSYDNFVVEEWANAINELFVVEGSKGMTESDCKRLLHYLTTHLPMLATHHDFLCNLLLPTQPSGTTTDINLVDNKT